MNKLKLTALVSVAVLGSGVAGAAIRDASASSAPRATLGPYHFDTPDMKIFSRDAKDVVITQFSIAPGKSTGWHVHPGPTYVIVTAGTLTRYEGDDPTCTGSTFGPSTGFVEAPNDVHIARNERGDTVVGMVAYLNVPIGGAVKTVVPTPGSCPF